MQPGLSNQCPPSQCCCSYKAALLCISCGHEIGNKLNDLQGTVQTQLHKTLELTKMDLFSEPVATRVAKEVPAIFWPEIKTKSEDMVSNLNLHPSSGHGKMSPYLFCLA